MTVMPWLLLAVSAIALLVGLIRPRRVIWWGTFRNRGSVVVCYGFATCVAAILTTVTGEGTGWRKTEPPPKPMFRQEHYDLVLKCIKEKRLLQWQGWAKEPAENLMLDGASLLGLDLRAFSMVQAHLAKANLAGSDIRGSDLLGSDLLRADLGCAKLDGARLSGARLEGAVLGNATLRGAELFGTDLKGANLVLCDLLPGAVLF